MTLEQRKLDVVIDELLGNLHQIKLSIVGLLAKLNSESLDWPSFLDHFALISSQLTAVSNVITEEQTPKLHNLTIVPRLLAKGGIDLQLTVLTEGRIPFFAYNIVADYLRTKATPQVEAIMRSHGELLAKNPELIKAKTETMQLRSTVNNILEMLDYSRQNRLRKSPSSEESEIKDSNKETLMLVKAVEFGYGLANQIIRPEFPIINEMPKPKEPVKSAYVIAETKEKIKTEENKIIDEGPKPIKIPKIRIITRVKSAYQPHM